MDYVLIASSGLELNSDELPDAENWKEFDGSIQYQGSKEFIVNISVLSKREYRAPWRARWKIGPEFAAVSVSQEGGSSSDSAATFLAEVFEALSVNCKKAAIDSPAGFYWLKT